MRYGYDLNNPKEVEMIMEQHQRNLSRQLDTTKTPQQKFQEILKE